MLIGKAQNCRSQGDHTMSQPATTIPGIRSLDPVFCPASLAVIGASADPTRIGGRPISHALALGFEGPVYPVNPTRDTVQGLRAYKSVLEIQGPVDCAILALPDALVPDAVAQCAAKGVRAAVVFSGGFAEIGQSGQAAQHSIAATARAAGMRLLGPNCIGASNAARRTYLTFLRGVQPSFDPNAFNFGMVSQSGGYGSHIMQLGARRRLHLGHWATTGNEADIEFGEVLQWLADCPQVHGIIGYIEGVRCGETLIRGLELAHRAGKPVIVMKVGATSEGAAAAASHTASLAGADAVYDAVFRAYGVHRAASTEEVLDVAYALQARKLPRSRALSLLSVSGGVGVQMADFAAAAGLQLPPMPPSTQDGLRAVAPFGSPRNPVDITAQFLNQPDMIWRAMRLVLEAGHPSVLSWLSAGVSVPEIADRVLTEIAALAAEFPERLHVLSISGEPALIAAYEAAGCLVFEEPRRAVTAIAALARFAEAFAAPLPDRAAPPAPALPAAVRFNEVDAKAVLARVGIGAPREAVAADAAAAASMAEAWQCPVAVKIVSPDIPHKTEVGGVAIGLTSAAAVAAAVAQMAQDVAASRPQARVDGYLVSEMLADGIDCILGLHCDPVFGPVVMLGLGGVLVELLGDVAIRLAPVGEAEAGAMVRSLRGAALLGGYRGARPCDVAALTQAIIAVSRLAAANAGHVRTIEINPLRVLAVGKGVVALDAVIETGPYPLKL